jgi:hypothetical protein
MLPGALPFAADPIRLLKTGGVPETRAAVGILVNSAKTLMALTMARALYECNNGAVRATYLE